MANTHNHEEFVSRYDIPDNKVINSKEFENRVASALTSYTYDKTTIDTKVDDVVQIKEEIDESLVSTIVIDVTESSDVEVYTKEETNEVISSYTYDKATIDSKISSGGSLDPTQYYTKSETYGRNEVYTKTESNGLYQAKGEYAPRTHTHVSTDITDLTVTLSGFTYDKSTIDEKISQGGTFDPTLYYTKLETSGKSEIEDALSGKSDIGHTHDDRYYTETEIDDKLGSGFTSSSVTEVIESNERVTSAALNDLNERVDEISGNVTAISGDVETVSGDVVSAKAVTDFMSGHNTVTSLSGLPTDKRLVIATISSSTNELSLSGNTLTDGYEIHVIVKNEGTDEATITIPSSGGYVKIGNDIKIASDTIGEINIISDGESLYVRGA